MRSKGRGAIKPCFKLRGQWGERTCDFFQSFVCCFLSVFRSSSENCLFIDLNHRRKQRVHVIELMHQKREFCFKRATNYISKGRVAIKAYFKLRGQWGERRCDFFQSFVCCSFSVFRSSSENCLFIDLNHTSKQRVHVRELTHHHLLTVTRAYLERESEKFSSLASSPGSVYRHPPMTPDLYRSWPCLDLKQVRYQDSVLTTNTWMWYILKCVLFASRWGHFSAF